MDMIKVTKDMLPEAEVIDVCGKNNTIVHVKKHIPYSQKVKFAIEYIAIVNTTNNKDEIMYSDYNDILIKSILTCKYYTDIDVGQINSDSDLNTVFDWIVYNNIFSGINETVCDDMKYVDDIIEKMLFAIRETYRKQHDIMYLLKNTFGFLFTGQDLIESISKLPNVNNELIALLGAYQKQQENKPVKNDKLVTSNGIAVNFAKKDK